MAYPFYFDVQGGGGMLRNTAHSFFSTPGAGGSTGVGIASGFGFYYTPIEPRSGFDFQLGIQAHFFEGSEDSRYFATLIPYGVARLQMYMFYVSAGIAPLFWQRAQAGPGIDEFAQAQGGMAYLTEFGALYAATPKFSMGGGIKLEWFSTAAGFSMAPTASINFVMRFYFTMFGIGQDGPGAKKTAEFEGWRYIGQ